MSKELTHVLACVESRKRGLIEFCRRLIQTPSASGREEAVAKAIAEEMRNLGFDLVQVDKYGSVVGTIKGGDGPAVVFNGHMDHVLVGRRESWSVDPFGADVVDGYIYGRGSADMKAAIAAQVYAAGALKEAGVKPAGDVHVVAVVNEETAEGIAMRRVVEDLGIRPEVVVLGEPTSLNLAIGQRGRCQVEIVTKGRTAHGSMPWLGRNAVYDMSTVMGEVEEQNGRLPVDDVFGKATVAVIGISCPSRGGNVIPDECSIVLDRRTIPGESEETVLKEVEEIIGRARHRRSGLDAYARLMEKEVRCYTGETLRSPLFFPAWGFQESNPILLAAKTIIEAAMNRPVNFTRWMFSTDGVYTAAQARILTVGFGPGEEGQAHRPNERVSLQSIALSTQGNAALALLLASHVSGTA